MTENPWKKRSACAICGDEPWETRCAPCAGLYCRACYDSHQCSGADDGPGLFDSTDDAAAHEA